MKILRSIALVMFCAMSLFSLSAHAFSRANSATFTVGAGYEFFSGKRYLQNLGYPFVAVGYNFTDRLGIEGLLGIFHTNFKHSVPDRRQVSGTLFSVDGIYRFNRYQRFEPFVELGLGVTGLSPNRFDATNEANINGGVGALFFANQAVAFRVEARDFYTFVGGKNDVFLDAGVTFMLDFC